MTPPGFPPPKAVRLPLVGDLPADLDPTYRARALQALAGVYWGFIAPTAEEAKALLAATNDETGTDRNRKPRSFRKIMTSLNRLTYMVNGDTVVWDNTGRLRNGQNRLIAIAETGRSVLLACAWGVDPEAFHTYDQHAKRSGGDTLTIAGYKHSKDLAGALAWQYAYEGQVLDWGPEPVPNDQIVPYAKDHPDVVAATDHLAVGWNFDNVIPHSLAIFLWTQFSARDPAACRLFFDRVFKRIGLADPSHEYLLMNTFRAAGNLDENGDPILVAGSRRKRRPRVVLNRVDRAAICVKTWNRVREGAPPPGKKATLSWRSHEPFPAIS